MRTDTTAAAEVREAANHWEAFRRGEDYFTARLMGLIAKADPENRERLRAGFPTQVAFYEAWTAEPNGEAWIDHHLRNKLTDEDYEALASRHPHWQLPGRKTLTPEGTSR